MSLDPKRQRIILWLQERGVTVESIARLVYDIQIPFLPDLNMEECVESVERVLDKREVQNAVLTGLALDCLAEEDKLPEPLLSIIKNDDSLYGVDEILALSIVNVYGSIGLTNFGFLDKQKPGIVAYLNEKKSVAVNTFLDDIVCAIAAAAAGRIAHRAKDGTLMVGNTVKQMASTKSEFGKEGRE